MPIDSYRSRNLRVKGLTVKDNIYNISVYIKLLCYLQMQFEMKLETKFIRNTVEN